MSDTNNKHICKYCEKELFSKDLLLSHYTSCKLKSSKIIENLKSEIISLKQIIKEKDDIIKNKDNIIEKKDIIIMDKDDKYHEIVKNLTDKIASQNININTQNNTSNTSNIVNINNFIKEHLDCIDFDDFASYLDKFDLGVMRNILGYVNYAMEFPLNNKLICTDLSRKKFKYKNKDGVICSDPKLATISNKFFLSIMAKNIDIVKHTLQNDSTNIKLIESISAINGYIICYVKQNDTSDCINKFIDEIANRTYKGVIIK